MDPIRFVERVVVTVLRIVLGFVRVVWAACSGVAGLIVPKAVPGLRAVVAAILFVGVVVMFRQLLDATST